MGVRRVVLNDDHPRKRDDQAIDPDAATADDLAEYRNADPEATEPWHEGDDQLEAEALRAGFDEPANADEADDEARDLPLAPLAPTSGGTTRTPLPLTPAQRKLREEWRGVDLKVCGFLVAELEMGDDDPTSISLRGEDEKYAREEPHEEARVRKLAGQASTLDVAETQTPEGVGAAVRRALAWLGPFERVTAEAFKGGRPTKERRELRECVGGSLLDLYEGGYSHGLMADALGCSPEALRNLMAETNRERIAAAVATPGVPVLAFPAFNRPLRPCNRR